MLIRYLVCFFFFLPIAQVFSQDLKLNFETKKFEENHGLDNLEKLNEGDTYTLEILNINTCLYEVILETKDTILESELNFPSFTSFKIDGLESIISNITPPNLSNIVAPSIDDLKLPDLLQKRKNSNRVDLVKKRMDDEEKLLNTYHEEVKTVINSNFESLEKICREFIYKSKAKKFDFQSYKSFVDKIKEKKLKVTKSLEDYKKFMKGKRLSSEKKKFHKEILKAYNKTIIEALDNYHNVAKSLVLNIFYKYIKYQKYNITLFQKEIRDIKTSIDDWIFHIQKRVSLCLFEYEESIIEKIEPDSLVDYILKKRDSIKRKIIILEASIESLLSEFDKEMHNFDVENILKKDEQKKEEKIRVVYDSVLVILTKAREEVNSNNTNKLLVAASKVNNNKKYSYKSIPIQLNGDQSTLKLTIKPRDPKFGLHTYSTKYIFPKYKKWFIGTGSSFYISGLWDDHFSIKTRVNRDTNSVVDTLHRVIAEKNTELEIGTSLCIHAAWNFGKKKRCSAGGTVGIGISFTKKVRPRLLIGGNFCYGKRSKITLGLGVIIGAVDRLSGTIKLDEELLVKPEGVVVSKLEGSLYFQIGYIYSF